MTTGGWGAGPWGSSPWGTGALPLQVVGAVAIRTNLVRVFFSTAPYYSRDLDTGDASDPHRFSVVPVQGTVGYDGKPPRAVTPCKVDPGGEPGSGGSSLDVWVDRAMGMYPGQYVVAAFGLVSAADGSPIDSTLASAVFLGLGEAPIPNTRDAVTGKGDLAQPDSASALASAGLPSTTVLGSLPVGPDGDYAADGGLASYKKRVLRRLLTRKDSFAHLPGYGVGTSDQVKRLGDHATRALIQVDAESQVREEPETIDASSTLTVDPATSTWFLTIRARTTIFDDPLEFAVPLSVGV